MITKEQFIKLITNYQKWLDRMDQISEILDSPNLYESDWVEYTSILFEDMLNLIFKEEAADDINWWLFERSSSPAMWDENGKVIPTDTIEDLWDIVKDNQK